MSEELHRHRRHRRRSSLFALFLKTYWVEILIVIGLLLVIFLLIFEQMNIRGMLLAWAIAAGNAIANAVDRSIDALIRFRTSIGLSEQLAIPLLLVIVIALRWRIRWRLMRMPSFTTIQCPKCGGRIHRVHRHALDRLINAFVPVRRYSCSNRDCRWHGLRVVGFGQQQQPASISE